MTTPILAIGSRVKVSAKAHPHADTKGTVVSWRVTRLDPEQPWFTVQFDDLCHPESFLANQLELLQ